MTRTRSIGNRSDITDKTNGDVDEDDVQTNGGNSRSWTIYKEDDPKTGVPEDPDDPINRYVRDQLERIKADEAKEFAEELSAQTDGAADDEL